MHNSQIERHRPRSFDNGNRRPVLGVGHGGIARVAAEVLGYSPLPALVLEIPSQRIVATSVEAAALLAPEGGAVVGHLLEEYTADSPAPGRDLIAGGRLHGFETIRMLRRRHGADVRARVWIRTFANLPPSRYVLVIVAADEADVDSDGATRWGDAPAVVGTVDSTLMIERISNEAESLFRRSVEDLLGTSLLGLVSEVDVIALLSALSRASVSHRGVTLAVAIRAAIDPIPESLHCEILILPLRPAPSCAFVLLPRTEGIQGIALSDDLSAMLGRLSRRAQIGELARGIVGGISERDLPGLDRLTTRELEIATKLLDGDRPPGIAAKLCLSKSTVRNHLASIYVKLGVNSQQELIDLFRVAQSAGRRP